MRLLALALAVLAGCGKPAPPTLRIAAAASYRDLLERTAPAFKARHPGLHVTFSFEASGSLARQVDAGASYNVLLSADRESLRFAGPRVPPHADVPFLANRLALLSPESGVEGQEIWAVPGPSAPAGRAWSNLLLTPSELLNPKKDRKLVFTDNVRAALALFESGAATHACVYETDARLAKRLNRVTFPKAPDLVGYAAPVGTPSAAAADFLAWIRTPEFLREAAALGFRPPPPK